jgi:hypothetical protein
MRRGKTRTLRGMKLRPAPHAIAGWLLFVPALAAMGIWYIYLFVATPDNLSVWDSAIGQLRHTFSNENPQAWWFAWLVALPIACILFGVAYLKNLARTRALGVALLCCVVALAIATFALNGLGLALFVALPAWWGYRALHGAAQRER